MDECKDIGLIGVGLLGSALAERLLKAGFIVQGFDTDGEQLQALAASGGHAAPDAAAVARTCRRILLSLPHSGIVRSVVEELGEDLRAGALIIDTTTGAPDETVALARQLAERGIGYIDATVGGSSVQARDGHALMMVGGAPEHLEDARDILDTISSNIVLTGGSGSGARMKLVFNLVLGLNRAVLAEGLAFAQASGLDPRASLEVLRGGVAASAVMDFKGEKMLTRDFRPQARLAQHLKDVDLILQTAQSSGTELPLSTLHRTLLSKLADQGYGDEDNSAIIRAYDA